MSDAKPARRGQRTVTEQDLQDLYDLIKGSRYANAVIDAKAALSTKDFDRAIHLLLSVKEVHEQSLAKTTKTCADLRAEGTTEAETRARRLVKKEEKSQTALEDLERYVVTLERMTRTTKQLLDHQATGGPVASERSNNQAQQASATVSVTLPADFQREFSTAATPEDQLQVVRKFYRMKLVDDTHMTATGHIYFYRSKGQAYVVATEAHAPRETIRLQLAFSGQRMKEIAWHRFLELGQTKHLVHLVPRDGSASSSSDIELNHPAEPPNSVGAHPDETLDMGAFSQLLDAAIRSGLVPGADVIAHIRDREFRLGDYAKAFQSIENLQGKFMGAMLQRQQRLRREEIDIKSGKTHMSPKELQAKRARDTADTQRIERARAKFSRVLEGLRILMRS